VLAGAVVSRRRPPGSVLAAIALTWAGVALAVGALDAQVLQANARGSVYVLLCAATFATYFLVSERYTRRVGSLPFTVFAMTGAAAGLLAWYLPRHAAWPTVPDAASGWLLLLVLFSTVAPVLMLAEGVRRVGAQRGAIVSTVGPPFTIVVAWLLLDEKLTAGQLFGTVLIVAGILAVERARRRAASA
jgi:drug/metabolite transporter (DMT)-like permease